MNAKFAFDILHRLMLIQWKLTMSHYELILHVFTPVIYSQKVGFHAIECSRMQPSTGGHHRTGHRTRRRRVWQPCSHTKWDESDVLSVEKGKTWRRGGKGEVKVAHGWE